MDNITTPKTKRSVRTVTVPKNVLNEVKEYIEHLYGNDGTQRMFPVLNTYFSYRITKGSKLAGVERIRVHDLRHSHVSLLVHMDSPL